MNRDTEGPLNHEQLVERVADIRRQVEAQRQRDEEIARFAAERQKLIAEKGIDSHLQRLTDLEPER